LGDRLEDRATLLAEPHRMRQIIPGLRAHMKELLSATVEVVRSRFSGKVSYASLPFEGVDWKPFNIISTDADYRTVERATCFRADIHTFVAQNQAQGKPVTITEFGCATFQDAADLGSRGDIIEWGPDAQPVGLKHECTRDEHEQARYVRELLE